MLDDINETSENSIEKQSRFLPIYNLPEKASQSKIGAVPQSANQKSPPVPDRNVRSAGITTYFNFGLLLKVFR